jgi:hypothetical protein
LISVWVIQLVKRRQSLPPGITGSLKVCGHLVCIA